MGKRFASANEIAADFGFTNVRSIYYFVQKEGLPAYRVGDRRMLFDPDEVETWVRDRRKVTANGGSK